MIDKQKVLKHYTGILHELKKQEAQERHDEHIARLVKLEVDGLITPENRIIASFSLNAKFVEKWYGVMENTTKFPVNSR